MQAGAVPMLGRAVHRLWNCKVMAIARFPMFETFFKSLGPLYTFSGLNCQVPNQAVGGIR